MGAQGAVLRCLHWNHGMVACKISFESTTDRQRIDEQYKVLKDSHVKGYVMENIEEIQSIHAKKILKYIQTESQSKFLEKQDLIWILKCFIDILKAVTVLHDMNFSHRDLKPENVILAPDGKAKLIDLDASRNIQYRHSVTLNVGTMLYMAPEVHLDQNQFNNVSKEKNITVSKFCDLFSLGCMFMRMLTNCSLRLVLWSLNTFHQDLYGTQDDTIDDWNYFSDYGSYFHVVVATSHGESKLHHALYKELDKLIDPSWKVNDILGRCLMTMIQKDIETRRDCVKYIPILKIVKQSLEKDHNPDFSTLDLSILKEHQPSFIEKMMEENKTLKQENANLLQLKDKYEKLLTKHSIHFE